VRFVDTNVLLYAVSRDPAEQEKARTANEILASPDLGLSTQVLQEFYVQATRTSRADALSHRQASDLVEAFSRFTVQDVTLHVVHAALATRERYDLSYWDSAIIEAARELGCSDVLSEDLTDGGDYGGIRVSNAFGG